jgi:hypothetical protein
MRKRSNQRDYVSSIHFLFMCNEWSNGRYYESPDSNSTVGGVEFCYVSYQLFTYPVR